jgi:hypothetical protein
MQKRIFWLTLLVLGAVPDGVFGLWWGLLATIPVILLSWWIAYRSGWFEE